MRTIKLLVAMAIVGSGLVVAPRADALAVSCTDLLCLFSDVGYSGERANFPGPSTGQKKKVFRFKRTYVDFNDIMSSVINHSGGSVYLYLKKKPKGRSLCLQDGTTVENLADYGFDNAISSIKLTHQTGCKA